MREAWQNRELGSRPSRTIEAAVLLAAAEPPKNSTMWAGRTASASAKTIIVGDLSADDLLRPIVLAVSWALFQASCDANSSASLS